MVAGDHEPSAEEIAFVLKQLQFRSSAAGFIDELLADRLITSEDAERLLEQWDYDHFPRQTARYWRERAEGAAVVSAALSTKENER